MRDLIARCLSVEAGERPSLEEIIGVLRQGRELPGNGVEEVEEVRTDPKRGWCELAVWVKAAGWLVSRLGRRGGKCPLSKMSGQWCFSGGADSD